VWFKSRLGSSFRPKKLKRFGIEIGCVPGQRCKLVSKLVVLVQHVVQPTTRFELVPDARLLLKTGRDLEGTKPPFDTAKNAFDVLPD
jgi:hypothetical protein